MRFKCLSIYKMHDDFNTLNGKKMDINKTKKKKLTTAVVLSIMFVVGIPCIIVGATFGGAMFALMGFGIFCVVMGFYGSPIAWVNYGNFKRDVNIANSINFDGIRKISVICTLYGINEKTAYEIVSNLIQKRYVQNLVFNADGTELVLNDGYVNIEREKHLKSAPKSVACPFCGAQVEALGMSAKCPYCGNLIDLSDKK